MKKALILTLTLCMLCTAVLGMTVLAAAAAYSQDFESAADVAATGWVPFGTDAAVSLALVTHAGSKCLELPVTKSWHSPAYDIYSAVKAGGAGDYTIKMDISADAYLDAANIGVLIRGASAADANSFIEDKDGTNYYANLGRYTEVLDDEAFNSVEVTLTVTAADIIDADHSWLLMVDTVPTDDGVTKLYIDNVSVTKSGSTGDTTTPTPTEAPTESTADFSTIAYAVAAISGLGVLVIRKKK